MSIDVRTQDGITKVLLNHPPVNAFDSHGWFELADKVRAIGKSPKAMRLAKCSLNGIELLDIKKSYRFEQGFTLEHYTSPDSQEARDAFVEKRDAKFGEES